MDEKEKTIRMQELLIDGYNRWRDKTGNWKPSLGEYARYLGVKVASLDHWVNGTRLPDTANAIRLAEKLGVAVYDILDMPHFTVINDPKLRFLVDTWEVLDNDRQQQILEIVERQGVEPG